MPHLLKVNSYSAYYTKYTFTCPTIGEDWTRSTESCSMGNRAVPSTERMKNCTEQLAE